MIHLPIRTRLGRTACAVTLWALTALPACKAQHGGDGETSAAAPSGSASAGEAASGPCATYLSKVCEAAGKESSTCQATEVATQLLSPKACEVAVQEVAFSLKQITAQRGKCDELTKKICKEIGPKTETCQMVTDQTKQFPPERCTAMLEHLDEVVVDLKKREAANKPLEPDLQSKIATGDAPSFGPADAKVTLVEFSDFECPYCSRAAQVVSKIREKYGNQVRFVFRQYPLPFHKNAQGASEAALAAHAQGKFWSFHDRLFENQRELDRESLERHAKDEGLDVAQFKKALDDNTYARSVEQDMKLGEKAVVQGTPTLFLNGARVPDPTNFEGVSKLIDAALQG